MHTLTITEVPDAGDRIAKGIDIKAKLAGPLINESDRLGHIDISLPLEGAAVARVEAVMSGSDLAKLAGVELLAETITIRTPRDGVYELRRVGDASPSSAIGASPTPDQAVAQAAQKGIAGDAKGTT